MKKFWNELFCRHIYRTINVEKLGCYKSMANLGSHISSENRERECHTKECIKCGKIEYVEKHFLIL